MYKIKCHNFISGITLAMFIASNILLPIIPAYAADTTSKNYLQTAEEDGVATSNKAAYTTGNGAYAFNITNVTAVMPSIIGCTGITNKIKKGLTDLFDSDNTAEILKDAPIKMGTGNYKAGYDDGSGAGIDVDGVSTGVGGTGDNVPTGDSSVQKTTDKTAKETEKIKEEEKQKKLREECLNGVAYALAKAELASITQKTVNWINSGFKGDPLFVRDRESYFKSLANEQLEILLGPISSSANQNIYPFGQNFARSAILSAKSKFIDKGKSTLSKALKPGATTSTFANDFSQGGWDGWFSLTQNPQNNPIGFSILASQELEDKKSVAQENAKEELAQGDGFLSQKTCVEYAPAVENNTPTNTNTNSGSSANTNYTFTANNVADKLNGVHIKQDSVTIAVSYNNAKDANDILAFNLVQTATGNIISTKNVTGLKKGENSVGITFDGLTANTAYRVYANHNYQGGSLVDVFRVKFTTSAPVTGNQNPNTSTNTSTNAGTSSGDQSTGDCIKWETVTPGTVIADQLKVNLGSSVRQLELADSLNESLSAIFEALVNQLVNQGLSSLSNAKSNPNFGGPGANKVYDTNGKDVSGTGTSRDIGNGLSVNKGSGWSSTGEPFDITKDLGDIYKNINGKRTVVKKGVITIQRDYIKAVNNSVNILPKILPALGELDYCIPGPNPKWYVDVLPKVNEAIDVWADTTVSNGDIIPGRGHTTFGKKMLTFVNSTILNVVSGLITGIVRWAIGQDEKGEITRDAFNLAVMEAEMSFALLQSVQIKKLREDYKTYKAKMDELYGPGSPMRNADPNNPWYLPMAESGLALTKNILAYEESMPDVNADYVDEVNKTNANIYKLEQIKKQVDKIVAAAKKRRSDAIRTGVIKLPAECLGDVDQTFDPNKIRGMQTNTTGNTGTSGLDPNANTRGTYQLYKLDFTVSQVEELEDCSITIYTKNNSINTVGPFQWSIVNKNGMSRTIYGSQNKDVAIKISSFFDSGNNTIKLKSVDSFGDPVEVTKVLNIKARNKTLEGRACPVI